MSASHNESEGLGHSAEVERIEVLYRTLDTALTRVLIQRYVMTDTEARSLLEEALYAYLQVTVPTSEPHSWINATVMMRAEELYPKRGTSSLPDDIAEARKLIETVRGLDTLPDNARRALRLRALEQWSYEDIAADLGITVRYARRLVVSSIAKLKSLRSAKK